MKKTLLLCTALFALGLFASCDPAYTIDYTFRNRTGHEVTLKSSYPFDHTLWDRHPNGITVANRTDTLFCTTDGIGSANRVTAEADIRTWVYGDTVTFTFDDGKKLTYLRRNRNGVFDLYDNHYIWYDEKGWWGNKKYACLTFTLTAEDYNRAR